ncbi:MAG: bifunctional hydroxymethylpyrimidine kinase/phosphomethylpyrimidine kinase [Luteolibacter sp.]
MPEAPPVVLTIAGSDCSAGAGIQSDLKTFQHFGTHGLTAVTCVVSETANIVRTVHPVPVDTVIDQAALMLDSFPVAAIKTGMLFSAAHVQAVAELLVRYRQIPLVVDPVMVASTGDPLLEADAITAYREHLLPMARVITPNIPEAEVLGGSDLLDASALDAAARSLAEQFGCAVLLKGGHLPGPECVDLLIDAGECHRYSAKRIDLPGSHGTGCTFSAAITAALSHGLRLEKAVETAKNYLNASLAESWSFPSPTGGSVHALNQGCTLQKWSG